MQRTLKPKVREFSSVRERAYQYIQQQITSGLLVAGAGISDLQLAKDLGSNRTPICEAMNKLAAEGLLEENAGGGMIVAQLRREHIIELYELREALELYAISKAVLKPMVPSEQERIQKAIDLVGELENELRKAAQDKLNPDQMKRFLTSDLGFHALLVGLAHNSRLQKVISGTRLLISAFNIKRLGHDAKTLRRIRTDHQTILEALRRQDGETARTTLLEHLQVGQKQLLLEYDETRREDTLRLHVPAIFLE